jgi:hypothetical protein
VAAAIVALAMVVTYVILIMSEGNNSVSEVLPWALAMLAPALGAASASQMRNRRLARKTMFVSAGLLLALGVLSIFTIGLGFIVAGALALVGATKLSNVENPN